MHEQPDPIIEEWKQLSTDFGDSLEIEFFDDVEFLDDEDVLEVINDSEL
jgi:hypothetical protein